MHIYSFNILLLSLLLISPANGTETLAPINEKLYYEASFSGVNIGRIGIEIDQQEDKANVVCDITTSGVLAWFVKHSSHTTLVATGKDFKYPNRVYDSHYRTRKKSRAVKLSYKDGKIIERIIYPPESKNKRPDVPYEDKNSAYDLMSFLLQMRTEITNARKDGKTKFTMNAYDGRRLTQANFIIAGEKTIRIGRKKYKTIMVISRRKQITGFTKKEVEKFNPNEPSMTSYFSNDKKLLPLRMEATLYWQTIRAELVKTCDKEESCLLGIKE